MLRYVKLRYYTILLYYTTLHYIILYHVHLTKGTQTQIEKYNKCTMKRNSFDRNTIFNRVFITR